MKTRTEIKVRKALITILSMIMFICCLYPWNSFLAATVDSPPLTVKMIFILLVSAYSFLSISSGSRLKMVYISAAFLISFFSVSSLYYNGTGSGLFYFFPVRTIKGVLNYLLLITYTFLIWYAASGIRNAENIRRTGRARFDTGLSFFLLLFIVKLLISFKGGDILVYDKYTDWFILYLFSGIFLLSVFSDEVAGGEKKVSEFLWKIIISVLFMLIILSFVFIVLYNFAPELKEIASAGSGAIGEAATPVEKWAVIIIRFLMDLKYRKKVVASLSSGNAPGISMGAPDNGFSDIIVIIFFLVIMLPLIALLLFLFFRMIIRRLLKISGKGLPGENKTAGFFAAALQLIRSLYSRLFSRKKIPPAVKFYRLLRLKGRLAGVIPFPSETPIEYGKRLASVFSVFEKEIMEITEIFCRYIYGKTEPSDEMVLKAGSDVSKIMKALKKRKS